MAPTAYRILANSAGTNFKVGGTGPERTSGKNVGRAPQLFGSKSTISRFGERFRDGQYSMVSFLVCGSSTHGAPRAQPFVKVGAGHVPHGIGATDLSF